MRVRVEVWSDVICPWCGLGKSRLDAALRAFGHQGEVEVVYRSFELDPRTPPGTRPVREMLREKYGLGPEQVAQATGRVEQLARAEGLEPYIVGDNQVGNTFLCHQLLAMASDRGLQEQAWSRLYRAYFGERRSIFDLESLVALGAELGLDAAEVRAALTDGRYAGRVRADGEEARRLGANGVPFVVVDRQLAVSGAQPVATMLSALQRGWSARPVAVVAGESCGPDGCA